MIAPPQSPHTQKSRKRIRAFLFGAHFFLEEGKSSYGIGMHASVRVWRWRNWNKKWAKEKREEEIDGTSFLTKKRGRCALFLTNLVHICMRVRSSVFSQKKIILPCVGFPAQQCPKRRKEVIARNPHRQFFGGRSAGGKQGNQSGVTTIPSRSHQLVSTAKESEEEEDLRL